MPINFVQSGKTLQLNTNIPQLNLLSQETKVELKKQEGTIDFEKESPALGFYGGGIDEVFIGNEPPTKKSIELWIDTDEDSSQNGSITIDDFLSLTSKNPVQNKVITKSLNERLEEEQYLTNSEIEKLLGGKL